MKALLVSALLAGLATISVAGCSKKSEQTAAPDHVGSTADALVEQHDGGSVSWNVTGDGKAHAVVLGADGKPVTAKLDGTLTWNGRTVPMNSGDAPGALDAQGPTLEADITQIGYAVTVDDGKKTFKGSLHLPRGGTQELADGGRAAARLKVARTGPHGGRIQVVGDDRLEIVENPANGDVRVYVLDTDMKPEPIEDRRITLAIVSDKPEVVVLTPGPKGEYATGKLVSVVDPVKVTVSVSAGEQTHVALVDYEPGVFVIVGAAAPHVRIVVKGGFWLGASAVARDDDDDDDQGHHHHHTNIHIKNGKHGHIHINEH